MLKNIVILSITECFSIGLPDKENQTDIQINIYPLLPVLYESAHLFLYQNIEIFILKWLLPFSNFLPLHDKQGKFIVELKMSNITFYFLHPHGPKHEMSYLNKTLNYKICIIRPTHRYGNENFKYKKGHQLSFFPFNQFIFFSSTFNNLSLVRKCSCIYKAYIICSMSLLSK